MVSVALFVGPRGLRTLLALLAFIVAAGPLESAGAAGSPDAGSPANVDATRLVEADHDAGNWMTYGRTYSEQRFSPLAQISADNVRRSLLTTSTSARPPASRVGVLVSTIVQPRFNPFKKIDK